MVIITQQRLSDRTSVNKICLHYQLFRGEPEHIVKRRDPV